MAYGLYLKLDQGVWGYGDYSPTNKLTGTIYSDKQMNTPADLTGKTLTIRIFKENKKSDYFDKTASIVSGTAGTWEYAVNEGELPGDGIWFVKVEVSDGTSIESTLNRVDLVIREAPTGSTSASINALLLEDGGNLVLE